MSPRASETSYEGHVVSLHFHQHVLIQREDRLATPAQVVEHLKEKSI